jgi:hypothetical protein
MIRYGTDMTANAARSDPVIGRDDEIRRVVRGEWRGARLRCEGGDCRRDVWLCGGALTPPLALTPPALAQVRVLCRRTKNNPVSSQTRPC